MTYLDKLGSLLCNAPNTITDIRLVVFDVDGVLTDGRLYYTAEGESIKAFHVRDGVALKLLSDVGISVAIMTAKDSPMVRKRVEQLGVQHYFCGVKDKSKALKELVQRLGITEKKACFVGDDMVDLPPMHLSGLSICPNDAYGMVRDSVDIVLPVNGGCGVARMVCDLLLAAEDRLEECYQMTTQPEFERSR